MGRSKAVKNRGRMAFLILIVTVVSQVPCMIAGEDGMAGDERRTVLISGADAAQKEIRKADEPEMIIAEAEDTWISEEYQEYCKKAGGKYDICPELLMAMIERESGGDAEAVNSGGDTGLLQVNERWHHDRMERLGVTDLYDPYSNILVAADYLAELFERDKDLYLVLMKYNMSHSAAEELHGRGTYSEYAMKVAERAWELEMIHDQEGE